MALFPSPLERTVASALLLLSSMPQPPSPSSHSPSPLKFAVEGEAVRAESESKRGCDEESLSLVSRNAKSCSSILTSASSYTENRSQKLRIVAVVASSHKGKLKVVRKRRSQVCWSSGDQKMVLALPATVTSGSVSTEDSCLSSTSSAASRARICNFNIDVTGNEMKKKKPLVGSSSSSGTTHMMRQAEAILNLLSRGCFSEVRIRQVLGDSPDTSKALRMLLRNEEIIRSGTGGRPNPYIYKIA